ncbi:MAG: hypothetical protein VX836_02810 [Pseudomonadota bacterium]|nr:hypothetical protein [Pseudomonadota bacterium]
MTLNIDPSTERALIDLASQRDMSVNALLSEFAAEQKRYWQERAEDMAALDAMQRGDFVAQDEMMAKFDRLTQQARDKSGTGA